MFDLWVGYGTIMVQMRINRLYLNIFLVLFGLGLVYFIASSVVPKMLVTLTKAAPASVISLENSYFIGGKLLAVANGKDTCVVNVFALDSTGKGVKGKNVEISGMGDQVITGVTETDGKVMFQVKSSVEGQFKLTASIDGVVVGKPVTVTFRN